MLINDEEIIMITKTMLRLFSLSLFMFALIGCDTDGVSPDENLVDGNISLSMGVLGLYPGFDFCHPY